MELFARDLGGPDGPPPLVILHGLLGSSRNWATIGRDLAVDRRVFLLDARNHGASFHAEPHTYGALAADVVDWLRKNLDRPVVLMGHSMGGKTAMRVACRHPELVCGLVVVDIVPKDYSAGRHDLNFAAMLRIPLDRITSREEAEALLEPEVKDWAFRKFLLSNLERTDDGVWRWIPNLSLLHRSLRAMEANSLEGVDLYGGPTLFLFGAKSGYFEGGDHAGLLTHFPAADLEFIAGSGHNPHFDQRELFLEILKRSVAGWRLS